MSEKKSRLGKIKNTLFVCYKEKQKKVCFPYLDAFTEQEHRLKQKHKGYER